MASGGTQLYIWIKIDDGQERNPVEIQTISNTSVSQLIQTVLGKDLTYVALSKVNAQSSDGATIKVCLTVKDLLEGGYGTQENPLLLIVPEDEGPAPKQRRLLCPPSLDGFWKGLPEATIVDNTLLQLPKDLTFLGVRRLKKHLFIRKAYLDLHELIHNKYDERNILILGNPGTGKTFFMMYEMFRLRKKVPIVCNYTPGEIQFVGHPSGEIETFESYGSIEPILKEAALVIHLFDATSYSRKRPVIEMGKTKVKNIVFSSPEKENYHQFVKDANPVKLFMPTWELDELLECNSQCSLNVNEDVIRTGLEKWGGIARCVLEARDVAELDRKIMECSTDSLIKAVKNSGGISIGENSHMLLQLNVVEDGEYKNVNITFASPYVRKRFIAKRNASQQSMAVEFVNNVIGIPSLGTARGELFEILAHQKLVKGGTFIVRKLEDRNQISSIHLDQKETVEIRTVEDIGVHRKRSCYLKPTIKNFVAVDGIIPPAMGFQMTVSLTHPVKIEGLKKILTELSCSEFQLYFVVPKDIFEDYPPQHYHNKQRKREELPAAYNVVQWALLVEF